MYCLPNKILNFLSPFRFVSVKDTLVPTDEGEKSKVSSLGVFTWRGDPKVLATLMDPVESVRT